MAYSPIPGFTLPKGTSMVPAKTTAVVKKTAAPGAKPVVAKTTVAQPPPAAPNYATLMAQAATQASKLAAAQIAAQVKAITDQQTQLHATASAQAAEINKASLAAAQFLSGLGDMTKSDYTAAVQNLGGMAQGYTGALRDTAQQAADAAQAQLSSIPGNEQTAVNRGNDLANLVYGVSGQIPANALAVQGIGATELARAEPGRELSYGQQQAIGQIGEGNKAADALNSQIATIRATLPSTTSTYLTQLEKTAQDQITNARNATSDYWSQLNTKSEIAARKATDKRLTKAAADKAKADAAKLQPVLDIGRTKLTGVLTDQFGHPITKTIKGTKFLQTAPGWHFDKTGTPVPNPKPTDPLKVAALAAEWTGKLHYRADSGGNALLTSTGAKQPVAPYILDPNDPSGQTLTTPTKPGKAFVPKPIQVDNKYAFVGQDNAIHFFKNAAGGTIPWPEKGATLKLFNSGGFAAIFDPATRTTYFATDNNGTKLPWGTPKAPPAVHYGAPKVGRDGYYYTLDPTTGTMKRTDVLAPEKATATHYSGRYPGADGFWHVYDTSTAADIRLPTRVPTKVAAAGSWRMITDPVTHKISFYNPTTGVTRDTPFKGAVPGQATGTYSSMKGTDGKLWRINSVTNKVVKTQIPWPTSASGGSLTTEQASKFTGRIENLLIAASTGKKLDGTKVPIVKTRVSAIEQLQAAGLWTKGLRPLALAILNSYYPATGAGGKNWIRVANPALSGG